MPKRDSTHGHSEPVTCLARGQKSSKTAFGRPVAVQIPAMACLMMMHTRFLRLASAVVVVTPGLLVVDVVVVVVVAVLVYSWHGQVVVGLTTHDDT